MEKENSRVQSTLEKVLDIEPKAISTADQVLADAKITADNAANNFKKIIEPEKFNRKKAFTSGEHQPKPAEAEQELAKITLDESLFKNIFLYESFSLDDLAIEGFEHDIEEEFEDCGHTGYNVTYFYEDTPIITVEIWDDNSPVSVIENLYAPNLFDSTYSSFESFAGDLQYKMDKYFNKNINEVFDKENINNNEVDTREIPTSEVTEDYDNIETFCSKDSQNGNAFWIMGYCANAMKECGLSDEIGKMRDRAMSGDYDNLCAVCDEYIQKCNEIVAEYDDDYQVEGLEFVTQGLVINEDTKPNAEIPNIGDRIIIISMEGEPRYDGKEGEVLDIDDIGQLHGTWGGLAVIPDVDKYEIIG